MTKRKSRKGRKRTPTIRERNGRIDRLSPEAERKSAPAGALLMRMRELARQAHDEYLGTPLGCLFMEEKISSIEYKAGQEWDSLASSRRRAIGAPSPDPKSAAIVEFVGGPSVDPDPDSDRGAIAAVRDRATIERYEAAEGELLSCGRKVLEAVRRLCEGKGERPAGHEAFLAAQTGLRALAKFWRLTNAG